MKICPKCQAKYDEAVIRFCTRCGSPLVDENPTFTALPSQSFSSADDVGEETVISRKRPVIPPPIPPVEPEEPAKKLVIPIGEEKKQVVRPIENPPRQTPPRRSNAWVAIFLTIFGTVALLAAGIGGWWLLSSAGSTQSNTNSNSNVGNTIQNITVNYNTSPTDFGFNSNVNSFPNTNINANGATPTKTPTPTPTKTPTPKPSANANANANANVNSNSNVGGTNATPANTNLEVKPTPAPTSTPTPKASATPSKTPASNVNVGIMNSRAKELRKPAYPPIAKQAGASGQVVVQVSIDEDGNVISAKAVSGPMLLRVPAEAAARQSSFNPVKVGDTPVRANGTIVYNFINQ